MVRVCLVGVSGYAGVYYKLLTEGHAAGVLELVGATIINQEEEQERCASLPAIGCRVYADYRSMLHDLGGMADLCCIPTGTPLHMPMTVAALEAGMHVLVEKPAAGCLADVQAMQAAAQAAGKRVAVGYQHMYTDAVMAAKRAILAGTIGALQSIKCLVLWPRDEAYYRRNDWAGRLTCDGLVVNDSPFNNAVAHELMMMLFQAGMAEDAAALPVAVRAGRYRVNAIESCDTACLAVETAEGVPLFFYATHACCETLDPEICIRGQKGQISLTHQRVRISADGAAPITLPTGGGQAARQSMLTAVLDMVQGGTAFTCDLALAARQTAVVDMVQHAGPIQVVAGGCRDWPDGKRSRYIPDIEQALRRAADAEVLLQDLQIPVFAGGRRDE